MPAVRNKQLLALLLEESFPAGCVIEGVDFNHAGATDDELALTEDILPPGFLQRYQDIASSEVRQRQEQADDMDQGGTSADQGRSSMQKLLEKKKASS